MCGGGSAVCFADRCNLGFPIDLMRDGKIAFTGVRVKSMPIFANNIESGHCNPVKFQRLIRVEEIFHLSDNMLKVRLLRVRGYHIRV